ncbi:MAG: hypothetical protein ACI4AH_02845 [Muribaculaceae bacterium]
MNSKLVLFLSLLFFVSCGNSEISDTLSQAESVMDEQPDSALALLKQIDGKQISSDSQNARYALLYSQALDKNYIDVTNDSLINIAVAYYQNHGSARNRFLSLFYQGRVYYNAKDYAKSMIAYTQAEQLYDEFDDDYYKGLLQMQKGFIYEDFCDYKNSLNSYKLACDYYEHADRIKHRNFAKYSVGTILRNSAKTREMAAETFLETIELAKNNGDTVLIKNCLADLIILQIQSNKYDIGLKYYYELKDYYGDDGMYSILYSSISTLNAYKGDFCLSDKYADKALKLSKNIQDSITYYYRLSEVAEFKKDFESAYQLLSKAKTMEVPEVRARLEQPILSEQIKVIEKDLELSKYKQRNNAIMFGLTMVIAAMLLVYLVVYYRNMLRRKQQRIDDYTNIVIDLQHAISDKDSAASETIQSILQSHNYLLNNIGDSLSLLNSNAKLQKVAVKEMKNIIVKFSEDEKTLQELEDTVNRCCNNVMSIVRTEVPNLGEEDYRQLCYHFVGFSGKLISILLNIGLTNVYTRKSRLKEKIMLSDAEHKDLILVYLSESPYLQ